MARAHWKMPQEYDLLFEQIHKAINIHTRMIAPRQGVPMLYRRPTDEEIRYLLDMSALLERQKVENIGNDQDRVTHINTLREESSADAAETLKSCIVVNKHFGEQMYKALAHPESGKFAWPDEEKKDTGLLQEILRIHNAMDKERGAVGFKTAVNFNPELIEDANIELAQGVCIYRAVPYDWHQAGKAHEQAVTAMTHALPVDDNRPKVFYCGGRISQSEEKDYIHRVTGRTRFTIDPAQIDPNAYDLYILTYNNRATMQKWRDTLEFRNDPAHHVSAEARSFVEQFLRSLYTKEGKEDRCFSATELKHRFSLVTFLGYSYGTVFIQEVRNAMTQDMKEMGYDAKTIADALPHIAAFNLASVGIVERNKKSNFTQVHINARTDHSSEVSSNLEELTGETENPYVAQYREGTAKKAPLIALQCLRTEDRIPNYRPYRGKEDERKGIKSFTMRDKTGSPREFADGRSFKLDRSNDPVKGFVLDNTAKHHIGAFSTTTGVRTGDGKFAIAATPAAKFITNALRAQIKASVDIAEHPEEVRDASAIMAEVANKFLTPEALEALAQESETAKQTIVEAGGVVMEDGDTPDEVDAGTGVDHYKKPRPTPQKRGAKSGGKRVSAR